jgi:hypothetical protein
MAVLLVSEGRGVTVPRPCSTRDHPDDVEEVQPVTFPADRRYGVVALGLVPPLRRPSDHRPPPSWRGTRSGADRCPSAGTGRPSRPDQVVASLPRARPPGPARTGRRRAPTTPSERTCRRRVGILDNHGQLGGASGHARPLERRGDVVTVAGVDAGNGVPVGERRLRRVMLMGGSGTGNIIAVRDSGLLRGTATGENLVGVWLSSVRLGASEPELEIDAGGLPGTATCCFEHALQVR